jgi:hypothetical protein
VQASNDDARWAALKLRQLWWRVARQIESSARLDAALAMRIAEALRER